MLRISSFPNRFSSARVVLVLLLPLLLGACASASFKATQMAEAGISNQKVVLMPIDIELSILHAGGALEPQAAWTRDGKRNLGQALRSQLQATAVEMILSDQDASVADLDPEQIQLIKLHNAVGRSILAHQYPEAGLELPTKGDDFDWTLGDSAQLLKQAHGADYALFVYVRDSYSSAGRVALQTFVAILSLGRAIVPGGQQVGFASLVDLNSGQVVWFNRLARETGDLRTADEASETAEVLLDNFPG